MSLRSCWIEVRLLNKQANKQKSLHIYMLNSAVCACAPFSFSSSQSLFRRRNTPSMAELLCSDARSAFRKPKRELQLECMPLAMSRSFCMVSAGRTGDAASLRGVEPGEAIPLCSCAPYPSSRRDSISTISSAVVAETWLLIVAWKA